MCQFNGDLLSAPSGSDQLFPDPLGLGFTRCCDRLFNLAVFPWRKARGNEFTALFFFGKRGSAD